GLLAPFIHYKSLKRCALFKTNQISGSWTGLIAKTIFRKPLIVRCGFIWSRNVARQNVSALRTRAVMMLEGFILRRSDLVFVATEDDRNYLLQKHRILSKKVVLLPNPIDTELFRPIPDVDKEKGLIAFVGRLEPEKNLDLLVRAVLRTPEARLILVGAGSQETALRSLAAGSNQVEFCGTMPNSELPELLNRAEVFVLPSQYEGSPKALLEAMACELPVIGTNAPGIRDVIQHGVNGLLCAESEQDIAVAIRTLLADQVLRSQLACQARLFVTEYHSQESVYMKEAKMIQQLIGS
ncbi:MAG: glycosyltransferase, partial [Chloroflexi bacterium]|nr:glycosyltransferase [Chloroflexota bacterium]